MRAQVVCLANSKMEKGRVLIGVLMKEGAPVVADAGPRWLHLVLDPGRSTVPSGLIVDILPMDLIEVDLPGVETMEQCRGTVVFDPYSLRFAGTLEADTLVSHCLCWQMKDGKAVEPATTIGSLFLLEAQRCEVSCDHDRPRGVQMADLQFESNGRLHRFPIRDPWFLEALHLNPDLLAKKPTHYVLVRQPTRRGADQIHGNVMTILF